MRGVSNKHCLLTFFIFFKKLSWPQIHNTFSQTMLHYISCMVNSVDLDQPDSDTGLSGSTQFTRELKYASEKMIIILFLSTVYAILGRGQKYFNIALVLQDE